MGFRFKNRQKAYLEVAQRAFNAKNSNDLVLRGPDPVYVPVVVLARLTEDTLDGQEFAYRIATSDGQVEIVLEEELLKENPGAVEAEDDEDETPLETQVERPTDVGTV